MKLKRLINVFQILTSKLFISSTPQNVGLVWVSINGPVSSKKYFASKFIDFLADQCYMIQLFHEPLF